MRARLSDIRPLVLALACLLLLPSAASARGFVTGYFDGAFAFGDPDRLREADRSGAGAVRVGVEWSGVAHGRPADAADPADPAYDWSQPDAAVAAARTRGLQVLLSVNGVPRWAEQGRRPRRYRDVGAYRPDPAAVGAFATAAARRYAGSVEHLQLLNEPNLDFYLAPQWDGRKPFAPLRYRALLNAAYPGVHAAGVKLVTAGTAPYGDPGRGSRIRPRQFWRIVMRKRVRFDVLAHHPYAIDGPRRPAFSKDDIAVPDVRRLGRLVRSRVRAGAVRPRRDKPLWVTEIGWDSKRPDPHGVPMKRFTRWVSDSFYVLWKQRVDHVFWLFVRDQFPDPSFAATRQSGMYFASGAPKPALRAFRFPVACERRGRRTRIWLRAPSRGKVVIEAAKNRRIRTVRPGGDRVALTSVAGHRRVRARTRTAVSAFCRP